VLRGVREGAAILRNRPALGLGLYQLGLALMVVFTIFALGPVYMVKVLGRSDQDTYIVLVPATFGLIATAAVLGQRTKFSRASVLVGAVLTASAALIVMGVIPAVLRHVDAGGALIPLAVTMALVFGCALGALLIPAFTVLQERTTPESRGRIFGGIFTVINAAVAVPLLLAGIIADLFGVDRVIAALGVLLLVLAVVVRTLGWKRLAVLEAEQAALTVVDAEQP